ncbi:MAG: CoB--CoM heterodisulfide reductase iron-sulfur subunit B family protein [Desulfosarcina sp.]|nr:CoB--CoM heterodisulfide reductase iron-sulfur subunit B family protein [Desulfobacterales bacterium]
MNYLYYPGCSLTGTAREYDLATRSVMDALGATLTELEDWTCCGASAAEACSDLLSLALPAINLAIAEGMDSQQDVLVPCSACYLNLKKTTETMAKDPLLRDRVNTVLAEKDLALKGSVGVRHLLDVLATDFGAEKIREHVKVDLSHLTIAPYYGCQCLRPYPVFDDPEDPHSMDPLIRATGAEIHPWQMGAKCCGASHMNTKMDVALELVHAILQAAQGADAIVTVCPMCQMNLEAYQDKIAQRYGHPVTLTILYLPQLIGMACGLSDEALGLRLNLALGNDFRSKLKTAINA